MPVFHALGAACVPVPLGEVLGQDRYAKPMDDQKVLGLAYEALLTIGRVVLPAVVEMLRHGGDHRRRRCAAEILERFGTAGVDYGAVGALAAAIDAEENDLAKL